MSFGQAIRLAFQNYAVFSGRSTRPAFWYFYLFTIIVAIGFSIIQGALGDGGLGSFVGILYLIWSIALILPNLGLAVRRLHDIDRTGWWILIAFVPLVGVIVLIVFWATPGTQGDNKHGAPAIA